MDESMWKLSLSIFLTANCTNPTVPPSASMASQPSAAWPPCSFAAPSNPAFLQQKKGPPSLFQKEMPRSQENSPPGSLTKRGLQWLIV